MKICERPEFKSKKPPLTFSVSDKVSKAVTAMTKDNFGSVIIVDKQKKVIGIVTERDLMKKLLFNSMNPKTTKLKDIMTFCGYEYLTISDEKKLFFLTNKK